MNLDQFPRGTTVALTGATGFVGRELTKLLAQRGATITALVRASSRTDELQAMGVRCVVVDLHNPATLIPHLEGCSFLFNVAGVVDFKDDWETLRQVNVRGAQRMIEAARQAGVRRFIHTSSIVSIGASRNRTVLDESSPWNLAALNVGYVTTKHEGEQAILTASGIDVVVVNPACVIGPGDHGTSEFGALCKRFWKGRIPFYFAGGNNFVDVRDVAEGHLRAALFGQSNQRYFLGSENLTYGEFFRLLATIRGQRTFRIRLPLLFASPFARLEAMFTKPHKRPYLPRGQARLMGYYFFVSHAKARAELGYEPRPVAESLREAYESYFGSQR